MKNKIFFVQFTNPAAYPPLLHAADIFEKNGWNVYLLGMSMPDTKEIRFESAAQAVFYWVPYPSCRFLRYAVYFWFCLKALWLAFFLKIDWIYGSDHWSLPVLYFAKKFLNKRVIYHEHDSPVSRQGLLAKMILRLRPGIASFSDIKIIPNIQRVADLNPTDWIQVKNCPSIQEAALSAEKGKEVLAIYYHGSLNPIRLPMQLLEAFEQLDFPFIFRFAGYETQSGYISAFLQAADQKGLSEKISYLGVLPRTETLAKSREAHVGIVLMPRVSNDVNLIHMCGASNKPYDYLASGCALLVSDLKDWKEAYVATGFGLGCNPDSSSSIAEACKWFFAHLRETIEMGRKGREKIVREWNYETEFKNVVAKMNEIYGS